ncbi:MAG: CopD family protein [Syntrophaceae bacterium]|nr:CopD family protein [Syntrophaceae bacterium]
MNPIIKKHLPFLIFLSLWILPILSYSTPEYAEQTKWDCQRCHEEPTGGKLTKEGEVYREDLKAKGLYRHLHPIQKVARLIIGYLHLLTAIAWFGTIFYVHILLKPAYAAKGLPKGELILGWTSMILMAVTGTLLTFSRMPNWEMFYTTRFGILLSVKIILFMIMVTSAAIVTFLIGPKMRKKKTQFLLPKKDKLTLEELQHFDGKEKKPAYFAYKGEIFDVSSSKLWKDGTHFKKHSAGNDLSDVLKTAPHGEEKILQMPKIGDLLPMRPQLEKTTHEKAFYFMAYMNLIFVFLITLIIALWRWW